MAISKKLLSQDEIVRPTHAHAHQDPAARHHHRGHPPHRGRRRLFLCACQRPLLALPTIWLSVLVLSIPLFVIPWIKWLTSTYTITTKRIITRHGIFTRTGHDLPLSRISDIQLEKNVDDRLFGCGTLFLQTSADDPLKLDDVPKVEIVQVEISNLLFHDVQGAIDADPTS